MNLEQIIRPFQDRGITPPKVAVGTRQVIDPIHVSFGAGGSTVFGLAIWSSTEFDTKVGDYKEVSRTTTTQRVTNPDDSSQYVDVKNTTSLFTRSKMDPDKKLNIEFKPEKP